MEEIKRWSNKKEKINRSFKKSHSSSSYFKPKITLETDNLNTTASTSSIDDSKTINIFEKKMKIVQIMI
jgi:hypothetical protein